MKILVQEFSFLILLSLTANIHTQEHILLLKKLCRVRTVLCFFKNTVFKSNSLKLGSARMQFKFSVALKLVKGDLIDNSF